jgi:hypothetical protein
MGLSKSGYDKIIKWARNILPKSHRLKYNFYAVKSIMKPPVVRYLKIKMCPSFCMLYYLENIYLIECKTCGHA